jgi:hypothetical protein
MPDLDKMISVRIDPDGPPTRIRVPGSFVARLDAVEAHHRGRGRRDVNRSVLVRRALERWLPEAEADVERERQ